MPAVASILYVRTASKVCLCLALAYVWSHEEVFIVSPDQQQDRVSFIHLREALLDIIDPAHRPQLTSLITSLIYDLLIICSKLIEAY